MGLRKRALRARRAPLGTELIYTFRDGLNFGEGILNIQVATAALRNVPDKNDSSNGNEHVGMQKGC